jgi:hypothetical protein
MNVPPVLNFHAVHQIECLQGLEQGQPQGEDAVVLSAQQEVQRVVDRAGWEEPVAELQLSNVTCLRLPKKTIVHGGMIE